MITSPERRALFRFVGWFFSIHGLIFCLVGYRYLQATLQSSSLFQNFMVDFSSPLGKSIVLSFTLLNYFSYMLLLNLLLALIPLLLVLLRPRLFWLLFTVALIASIGLLGLYVDIQLYDLFKFHLSKGIFSLIFNRHLLEVFDLTRQEIILAALVIAIIVSFEIVLVRVTWKYSVSDKRIKLGKTFAIVWLGSLLIAYFAMMLSLSQRNNLLIQQTTNLPFYNAILAKFIPQRDAYQVLNRSSETHYMQAAFSRKKMHYPLHALQCQLKKPYNIILIVVDSLRADAIDYMPHTQAFAAQNWQFKHHISGGNCTQSGMFSLYYSLPGTYWTAALSQHIAPAWIDLLQQHHYETQVFASAELQHPPLDQTIFQKITGHFLKTSNKSSHAERDQDVTSQAITYLKRPPKKPFFLNLLYNAPHAFCSAESFPVVYRPWQPHCSRIGMSNQTKPLPYYNNYRNTVDFIDKEIATLLKTIEQQGYLQNSVVIITSDHGQEFNENHQNYWGHASNYSAYQVQVPLVIHWPENSANEIIYKTSSYDIVPTLFSELFHCQNSTTDYSVGHDLRHPGGRDHLIGSSYTTTAIIEPDRLITIHTSGDVDVTDLKLNHLAYQPAMEKSLHQSLKTLQQYYE